MNIKETIDSLHPETKTIIAELKSCDFPQVMKISNDIVEVMAKHSNYDLLIEGDRNGPVMMAIQSLILTGLRVLHAYDETNAENTGTIFDHNETATGFMGHVASILAIYSVSVGWDGFSGLVKVAQDEEDESDVEVIPVSEHDAKSD